MSAPPDDPRWTAFLLGELSPEDTAAMENLLAKDPEARERLEELQETLGLLRHALAGADAPELNPLRREAVLRALKPVRRLPAWFPASAAALLAAGLGLASYLAWRATPPPLAESDLSAMSLDEDIKRKVGDEKSDVGDYRSMDKGANIGWHADTLSEASAASAPVRAAAPQVSAPLDAVGGGPAEPRLRRAEDPALGLERNFRAQADVLSAAAEIPALEAAPANQPVTVGWAEAFSERDSREGEASLRHRLDLNTNQVASALALGDASEIHGLRIDTNLVFMGTNAIEILPAGGVTFPTEPQATPPVP